MTTVLAIDTSGPVTSLGVERTHGEGCSVSADGGRRHAEVIDELMNRMIEVLGDERPDAIAVGVGPGPYSGLRVGIAFATGLGRAWQCPLVGVCSLDVIAWAVIATEAPRGDFVVSTDARRGENYWARYDATGTRTAGPWVGAQLDVEFDAPVFGDRRVDTQLMASRVASCLDDGYTAVSMPAQWAPHGADGSQVEVPVGPLLSARPLYLRAPDITPSAKVPADPGSTT
ncbi:MAG: tRNA (adenosine(37)-N6)-threonylcarbamoyltransferase complex dimerization subunit type 1 TsaB [Candidatus Nanopelagicales bacterium]|jgi:tRNA threonylcarbamoyladenosine biosynthesis protein TsaB